MHLRTCHHKLGATTGKLSYAIFPLKAKTKKERKKKKKSPKTARTKNSKNKNNIPTKLPCTTLPWTLRMRSDYVCEKNHRRLVQSSPDTERPERWSTGFSLRHVRQDFNSTVVKFAMATRTRDNTHKQTTFIISFSFSFFHLIRYLSM